MSEQIRSHVGCGEHLFTCASRHGRMLVMRAAPLALSLLGLAVIAQEPPNTATPQNSEPTIAQFKDHSIFAKEALFSGPIPHWSEGYLVTKTTESFSATTANVIVFGRDGSKASQAAIWFPDSQKVVVASAAISHRGGILAVGEADKVDGTRAPFIAFANFKGQVTDVIQTGDYFPRNVCEAQDESIWTFGGMRFDNSSRGPLPGNVLRRFNLRTGETASYIPRSTFPDRMQADAVSFIRCSGNAVLVYSNPAKILIEISSKAEVPRIFHITVPEGLEATGVAVTNSGDAYGELDNFGPDDGREGMYALVLDRATNTGSWKPVKGAVGNLNNEDVVYRVWGADGDSLVLSRSADPLALIWVSMSPK